MSILESDFYSASAMFLLPEKYPERLRTTNSIERLNEEIRRRERVIPVSPNREFAICLARFPAHGEDEKWKNILPGLKARSLHKHTR